MTTVRRDIFSKAVNTASKAISPNPVVPLLGNILFESNNGSSRVAGTNLEIGIGYTFPTKGEEFRVCIPAKVLSSLVDAMSAEEIDVEANPKDQSVTLMTESSTSNIRCAPADEFPDIPTIGTADFWLPVVRFKEMVQRVAFASRVGDGGSPMEAVQLSMEGNKLILFAVDGYHLSYEEEEIETESTFESFLVKGTTLETIAKILPEEGDVHIQVQPNKALFQCGNVDVVTQLMDGEFPSYELLRQAIPPSTTTLFVPTIEMLRAARQLRVFATSGLSKLEVKGMLIRCSVLAQDKGDADVSFAAVRKGKDITIGLNVNLLYELLEICKTDMITIEMGTKEDPILFKMKGVESFYHVIMPMGL
jgi:DNA polymerase-3 subunit beta